VATYQLYAARHPTQVQETIAEIASDLLGAERFVLLLRGTGHGECRVALARGFGSEPLGPYATGVYRGGDPIVDRTLEQGVRHLSPESSPIAVVPLQVDEHVVGALILIQLVGHKARLTTGDSEVLDLLGAHAASALTASEAYAVTSRKLQTLESLIQLARGAP
jgi:GAF domain-containing protein